MPLRENLKKIQRSIEHIAATYPADKSLPELRLLSRDLDAVQDEIATHLDGLGRCRGFVPRLPVLVITYPLGHSVLPSGKKIENSLIAANILQVLGKESIGNPTKQVALPREIDIDGEVLALWQLFPSGEQPENGWTVERLVPPYEQA